MPDGPQDRHGEPGHTVDPRVPGAGEVIVSVVVAAPVERVYAAFVAWDRQGEWIPRTRVRVVTGDGGAGSMIEAVTTVGPAVLRDEMLVDRLDHYLRNRPAVVEHIAEWLG